MHAGGAISQNSKVRKAEPDADSPVGTWLGGSVCTSGAPSCHDEKVVYYVTAIPDNPDAMFIRAQTLSDSWKYDRTKKTLSMESGERFWLLLINGKRIDGTLTVPG